MSGVTLKNVVKQFGAVKAVDNLSIEIQDKEFAVLVGPSGCGKTTALRMIAGLETDHFRRDLHRRYARQRHGAQGPGHRHGVPELRPVSAHERPRQHGLRAQDPANSKAEIDARVQEAADILGIHDLLERKPKELSGGQRQRVAVGRAIVRKPKLFLFDEPLSNLDAKLRVAMRAEISKLHRRLGATIIYVTHDQVEAMTMADRIFIMNKGVLQQSGAPMEVYTKPANRFVAGFIGSPAMNFIDATLDRGRRRPVHRRRRFPGQGARIVPSAAPTVCRAGRSCSACGPRISRRTMPSAGADNGNTVTTRAEVVETLGSEIFAHLTCGAHSIVARMDVPESPLRVGETLKVDLKMAKTHVFDTETSQTII